MNVFQAAIRKFGQSEKTVNIRSVVAPEETTTEESNDPQAEPCQKRDCGSCDSHHLGWCRAVPGWEFYNIKFLRACPLENSECEALTVNERHEVNIGQKPTLPSNGVTV